MSDESNVVKGGLAAAVPIVGTLVAIWASVLDGWALVGAVLLSGSAVWFSHLRADQRRGAQMVGVAVAAVAGIAVVVAAALSAHDTHPAQRAAVAPPATSPPAAPTLPPASPPTSTGESPPTGSADPRGAPARADMKVGTTNFIDLDTQTTSTTPTREHEVQLQGTDLWFYVPGIVYQQLRQLFRQPIVAVAPDTEASSYAGCERATDRKVGGVSLEEDGVGLADSVCVRTSRGAWAVMKVKPRPADEEPSAYTPDTVTFDVWVYER